MVQPKSLLLGSQQLMSKEFFLFFMSDHPHPNHQQSMVSGTTDQPRPSSLIRRPCTYGRDGGRGNRGDRVPMNSSSQDLRRPTPPPPDQ